MTILGSDFGSGRKSYPKYKEKMAARSPLQSIRNPRRRNLLQLTTTSSAKVTHDGLNRIRCSSGKDSWG